MSTNLKLGISASSSFTHYTYFLQMGMRIEMWRKNDLGGYISTELKMSSEKFSRINRIRRKTFDAY